MKLNENELRIGNYIECKNNSFMVKSYSIEGLFNICKNIHDFNPIIITENLLLNFGFAKDGDFHFWIKGMLIWMPSEGFFVHDKTGVVIKYLHQLQNLYFALNSEELQFKKK